MAAVVKEVNHQRQNGGNNQAYHGGPSQHPLLLGLPSALTTLSRQQVVALALFFFFFEPVYAHFFRKKVGWACVSVASPMNSMPPIGGIIKPPTSPPKQNPSGRPPDKPDRQPTRATKWVGNMPTLPPELYRIYRHQDFTFANWQRKRLGVPVSVSHRSLIQCAPTPRGGNQNLPQPHDHPQAPPNQNPSGRPPRRRAPILPPTLIVYIVLRQVFSAIEPLAHDVGVHVCIRRDIGGQ